MAGERAVPVEWAEWGKRPDGRDYGVVGHSVGALSSANFHRLLTRFSTGSADQPPVVSVNGTSSTGWMGLAIQENTPELDHVGRVIKRTRYFCLHLDRLEHPVTYRELHRAVAGIYQLPADRRPLRLSLAPLDPDALAAELYEQEQAITTAALLLQSEPVIRIVGADHMPWQERLRHLDLVAALLPYGMRPTLSASTWVRSTTETEIRLAFADAARPGVTALTWGEEPEATHRLTRYQDYRTAVDKRGRAGFIDYLSRQTEPLDFSKKGRAGAMDAVRRASDVAHSPRANGAGPVGPRVAATLAACVESIRTRDPVALRAAATRLREIENSGEREYRRDLRSLVREGRLLDPDGWPRDGEPLLPPEKAMGFVESVLWAVWGHQPTAEDLREIEADLGTRLTPRVLWALCATEPAGALARLELYVRIERAMAPQQAAENRLRLLGGVPVGDLVAAAVEPPADAPRLATAIDELVRRCAADDGERSEIGGHLAAVGYLARPLAEVYDAAGQATSLRKLIQAVHGGGLDAMGLRDVLRPTGRNGMNMPTAVLVTVAVDLHGPNAGAALLTGHLPDVFAKAGAAEDQVWFATLLSYSALPVGPTEPAPPLPPPAHHQREVPTHEFPPPGPDPSGAASQGHAPGRRRPRFAFWKDRARWFAFWKGRAPSPHGQAASEPSPRPAPPPSGTRQEPRPIYDRKNMGASIAAILVAVIIVVGLIYAVVSISGTPEPAPPPAPTPAGPFGEG
ncbi:hypothetical protein LO762_29530 [Actinocorallia sp. API 0066]|uniref:hypothetical protein n=1 Tax=Actinocorallia sp. API 0066 TaxID=2896846 RepID=UPI001E3441A8|nr:hypothetical protein [Actinocorallia sp. API 0066]MCD0453293.1 hypothetical protein [Actinocorallia sp. API 0066]